MTLTPAEKAYDDLKSGAIYFKPAATCPACSCELAAGAAYCDQCGTPAERDQATFNADDRTIISWMLEQQLEPGEEQAIDILLQPSALLLAVADYAEQVDEQPSPASLVEILETIEQHYTAPIEGA